MPETTTPFDLNPIAPSPLDPLAETQLIAARDGVGLATDVYLPPMAEARPTVLIRLPYDKNGRYTFMPAIARYLNAYGFAAVIQDVRGKFRSEGEPIPFVNEALDGYDTLEWIVAQPWSDGSVGMMGDSYYGFTQWAAASTGHPALKAIVPRVTGSLFLDGFLPSQPLRIPLLEWVLHTFANNDLFQYPLLSESPIGAVVNMRGELAAAKGRLLDLVETTGTREVVAKAFPDGVPAPRLEIPALHTGGWFDNLQKWQLDDWAESGSGPAAAHQFLRMDITDHEDFRLSEDGGPLENHESDDDALRVYIPRLLDEPISFFDHYLRGREGAWRAPRVRYRMAYAGWEVSDRWPPDLAEVTTWVCGEPGSALGGPAGGTLSRSAEDGTAEDPESIIEWVHDPADPVPFLVESEWAVVGLGLPDESPIHGRPDLATFTSDPQAAPLDILGSSRAVVTVDADSATTHVVVRLTDVDPDGKATFVIEGAAQVSCEEGLTEVSVRLGDIAYRIRAGHRLRVAIGTSCFPLYLVHPGTDESPLEAVEGKPNRQRLVVGGPAGARLELGVRRPFAVADAPVFGDALRS